jgi:LAO/AO transport system kinase
VPTIAAQQEGVEALWEAVGDHRAFMERSGQLPARRERRLRDELREIVVRRLELRARELCTGERWEALEQGVAQRCTDPWSAADEMLQGVGA